MILLVEARGHSNFEDLLKAVSWEDLVEVPGLEIFDHKLTPWEAILGSGAQLSYETEFDRSVNDFLKAGPKQKKILAGVFAVASTANLVTVTVFGNVRERHDHGTNYQKETYGPLYAYDFQGGGRVVYRAKNQHIHFLAIGIENGSGGGVWDVVKSRSL